MTQCSLSDFAADVAYIETFGFRFSTRKHFDRYAPQKGRDGIKETPGEWGVFDPASDYEGWALVGDDPAEIVAETARELEYTSGLSRDEA